MTSPFDPNSFLDSTITEPSVKRPPLPAGQVFTGTIGEIKMRTWQGKTDPTKSGITADIPIEIDLAPYPEAQKLLGGLTKISVKDSIMLDTNEGGMIDNSPGKNSKLRRYRESLDMNKPGQAFSIRSMQGRLIGVKIKHREYEGELYDDVDSVVKAA